MKIKVFVAFLILGGLLAIFTNKSFRTKILPIGDIVEEKPLSSDLIVTPQPIRGNPQVEILTSKGAFIIELRPDLSPKSVANFLGKWNSGACDNLTFHRVEDWVVQGCDPKGDGTGGNTSLATEISSQNFLAGSVGVARKTTPKELSNDVQFFIVKKDSPFLDSEYTYLGKVIQGMDVVNKLSIGDKITSTSLLSK